MGDIERKARIRRRMRELRDGIDPALREQWSAAIVDRVMELAAVREAKSVFCYVSMGSEVKTHELIGRLLGMGKKVAVPRAGKPGKAGAWGEGMEPCFIDSLEDLDRGTVKLGAFVGGVETRATFDVVIVPGVAFTAAGDRLGMGGGYYDRYLAKHRAGPVGGLVVGLVVGLCFDMQMVERLPVEGHDQKMNVVISESV